MGVELYAPLFVILGLAVYVALCAARFRDQLPLVFALWYESGWIALAATAACLTVVAIFTIVGHAVTSFGRITFDVHFRVEIENDALVQRR